MGEGERRFVCLLPEGKTKEAHRGERRQKGRGIIKRRGDGHGGNTRRNQGVILKKQTGDWNGKGEGSEFLGKEARNYRKECSKLGQNANRPTFRGLRPGGKTLVRGETADSKCCGGRMGCRKIKKKEVHIKNQIGYELSGNDTKSRCAAS